MAELALMTQISEEAERIIITTMSFAHLVDYMFGDSGKDLSSVLAFSLTDESSLYEVSAFLRALILLKFCLFSYYLFYLIFLFFIFPFSPFFIENFSNLMFKYN